MFMGCNICVPKEVIAPAVDLSLLLLSAISMQKSGSLCLSRAICNALLIGRLSILLLGFGSYLKPLVDLPCKEDSHDLRVAVFLEAAFGGTVALKVAPIYCPQPIQTGML